MGDVPRTEEETDLLNILMGRAGSGKSDWILRRIAELGDTSRQILLVPEHASHLAEVDLCRACGDAASRHAEVLSFRRLADRVLTAVGGLADVTLDAGGKLLTLQKSLMEVAPELKVYRRPSRKAAFLRELLGLFDELRTYAVEPETLAAQAEEIPGSQGEKLRDLALLYAAYDSRLHRPGFDARDRMSKCLDAVEESRYLDGKDIYLDGFSYFNGQERKMLSVMLRRANSVTVALLGEERSQEEIFESSNRTREILERLASENRCKLEIRFLHRVNPTPLGHLERFFFGKTEVWTEPTEAVRLRQAQTSFSEVEQTAADIRRLVAAGKCRYRDITVAARNMGDYESVIENVFERYGIPAYLSRRSNILETPTLSLLTGVLSAVTGGFEYEDMFRYLKTGLAGMTSGECDRLENYVLTWEIHGRMWVRDVDWTANPDGYGAPWDESRTAALADINALRRRVGGPLRRLDEGLKAGDTAGDKVRALYGFMEDLGLQAALEESMRGQAERGQLQQAEETAQLWDILCGVLDQFLEILGDERMDAEEFYRLFRLVVTQYSVGTIPVSLDQVSVSEITRNDRHTAQYLFLLGVNDHVLPAVGQSGGILNEDDRDALALRGIELAPTGMAQMSIELQNLYAALAQPTRGLCVSYPVADVSGGSLRPAFVIDRIRTLFPQVMLERESTDKEYRLTASIPALEMAGREQGGPLWRYFAENPDFDARLHSMERASSMERGRLSRPVVRALYGDRFYMSASRMEKLNACHFAYFMQYGLKAQPRRTAAFDAPQIGTFLHYLLENVTRECIEGGGFAQVEQSDLRTLVLKYTERYVEQELLNFRERNARFRYLFSRLRSTANAIVEQAAEELRHSDFVPLAFELSFGDRGTLPAVTITEPDGELRVTGKVDRVDGWVKDDKLYLRVVDYKTGRKSFDLSAVKMGLDIQMLLYLFTLQKEGKAAFGREIEPAGVLYFPARDEILSAQRCISPEKLKSEMEKTLRRSGLLLQDTQVLQAMEHEALTEPRYLPLRVSRDGALSGDIASAAQLGKLSLYVDKLLHRITREVRDGNIDADPYGRSDEDRYCQFCDFAGACHFQDGKDGDHLRYVTRVQPEAFWHQVDDTIHPEGGEEA